jgi:hypothetical protein
VKKSNFCNEHFAMNCGLCGDGAAEVAPLPTVNDAQSITDRLTAQTPQVAYVPPEQPEHGPTGLQPSQVQIVNIPKSEEGIAVLSVTDEYAKSCDDLKSANDAVKSMEDHLAKMTTMLTELKTEAIKARQRKDELKRKVLETLAMGGE